MKVKIIVVAVAGVVLSTSAVADQVYEYMSEMPRNPGFKQQKDGANHIYVKESDKKAALVPTYTYTTNQYIEAINNNHNGDNYTENNGTSTASNSVIGSWIDTDIELKGDGNNLGLTQDSANSGSQGAQVSLVDSLKRIEEDSSSGDTQSTATIDLEKLAEGQD